VIQLSHAELQRVARRIDDDLLRAMGDRGKRHEPFRRYDRWARAIADEPESKDEANFRVPLTQRSRRNYRTRLLPRIQPSGGLYSSRLELWRMSMGRLIFVIFAVLTACAVSAQVPNPGATRLNPKDGLIYVWIPPGTFTMGCSCHATVVVQVAVFSRTLPRDATLPALENPVISGVGVF